jgi:hypothetical protein
VLFSLPVIVGALVVLHSLGASRSAAIAASSVIVAGGSLLAAVLDDRHEQRVSRR